MVLRYPFLARTNQQLIHMEQMVQSAPSALRLSEQQLLPCFTKHPELFMYSGINGLAQKYHALAEIMQGGCTDVGKVTVTWAWKGALPLSCGCSTVQL